MTLCTYYIPPIISSLSEWRNWSLILLRVFGMFGNSKLRFVRAIYRWSRWYQSFWSYREKQRETLLDKVSARKVPRIIGWKMLAEFFRNAFGIQGVSSAPSNSPKFLWNSLSSRKFLELAEFRGALRISWNQMDFFGMKSLFPLTSVTNEDLNGLLRRKAFDLITSSRLD